MPQNRCHHGSHVRAFFFVAVPGILKNGRLFNSFRDGGIWPNNTAEKTFDYHSLQVNSNEYTHHVARMDTIQ